LSDLLNVGGAGFVFARRQVVVNTLHNFEQLVIGVDYVDVLLAFISALFEG